jgi:hypothetical protein
VVLLAALVVAGFRVRVGVAVDNLDRPLGILEHHHLLIIITLTGNLLLVFPLVGRHAIIVQLLLLLLTELLRELLDLPALLGTVAPRVMHRAPWPALVSAGGLAQLLVTSWAMTPTSYCSSSSGSSGQRLVVVAISLLLLPVFLSLL